MAKAQGIPKEYQPNEQEGQGNHQKNRLDYPPDKPENKTENPSDQSKNAKYNHFNHPFCMIDVGRRTGAYSPRW